ncbi:hypothetical protein GII36_05305 [Candidatus Mycosynbacter amalyticus]|uniref:Septum formation initiator family protein n=1 Tax=Candidatus Mycosynbacter amalyticus TaxID=2665156 RepID=A0A857MN04_9BACT|nr:hypothetical protein [Candidatus Mycosynbacter amalyticus]QHN43235.1 hypothetical protein GII36_05305 [Candidatus Mycosynbacter amalyticus]
MNTSLRRFIYHVRYRYPTREILTVVLVGIAIVWFIWGSVQAMQKNYELRKVVEDKTRQAEVADLEAKTLEYEQRYLQSEEYKKLAVRERLGYGDPGEKVLVLPANSSAAADSDRADAGKTIESPKPSNLSQWGNFLFGGNVRSE